jgi:hypothetical protein
MWDNKESDYVVPACVGSMADSQEIWQGEGAHQGIDLAMIVDIMHTGPTPGANGKPHLQ